jgi:GLPGLI family protein
MKINVAIVTIVLLFEFGGTIPAQDFQGKAYYFSKSSLELGSWGARMSEAQKKQIKARLKNRLEKTYILSFNSTESIFVEEEKIDAISGATDSWGSNFARGKQHKNISQEQLVQAQEFYGKRFLVKDQLLKIDWELGSESKEVGGYTCFKATAVVPTESLEWFNFSWSDLPNPANEETVKDIKLSQVEAWYTMQIPVQHGPAEFWGLPGLILEVSTENTTLLCSEIISNPREKLKISPPKKGVDINIEEYRKTIMSKMLEMRNNMGRRRR